MTSAYKQEESSLHKIINDDVTSVQSKRLKLLIYYKSRNLKNLFIKNNPHGPAKQSHVVYRYTCKDQECQLPVSVSSATPNGDFKIGAATTPKMELYYSTVLKNTAHECLYNGNPRTHGIPLPFQLKRRACDDRSPLHKERGPCPQREWENRIL